MINDLLQRLLAAETDEERSWIATESLLESLPEDVESALWAVAIPHWFDAEILAALCPELADRADEIYRQLQDLSCVEVFPERGHNVHELTRNQLLDRLRQHNPERFRDLSGKAAEYFANVDNQEFKIEWIYHLMATREDRGVNELVNLVNDLPNNFRRAELERNIKKLEFTQKRLQQAEITKRIAMGLAFSVFTSVLIYSGITGDKVLTEKVIIGSISVVAGAGSVLINQQKDLELSIKKLESTEKLLKQEEITKRLGMGLAFSVFTSVLIYSGITGDKVLTEKVIIGLISVVAGAGSILINQQKDKE